MIRVHSIETFGTHEGPGIRLVIFTQGCYFRCAYCHNPDTQDLGGGTLMKTSSILELLEREHHYFKGSKKGGLTVSGGEPTVQAKELLPLFRECKRKGIHTALDTNGGIATADVKRLYDTTDLVLLDIKHIDDEEHRKLTGMSNRNTLKMAEYREHSGKPMWLRYVLVPGFTDGEEYLRRLGERFKDYDQVERIEILPYHTLGVYKYAELGRKNPLEGTKPPTVETVARAKAILGEYFGPERVFIR